MAFKISLSMLPHIKYLMKSLESPALRELEAQMDELSDLHQLIEEAIVEEPPIGIRDGGIIREGFHEEVDRLRNAKSEGKTWLAQLEAREMCIRDRPVSPWSCMKRSSGSCLARWKKD